ncbi:MAG: nucleoside-diphosphate sugar epimerase/dehydratase [Acidobacteriota bacterium]
MGVYGIETATILCAALLAFLLRFDFSIPAAYVRIFLVASAVWLPVKLLSFKILELDKRWARYVSLSDLVRLAFSNALGSFVSLLALLAFHSGVPKSVYAIDFLLCIVLTAGVRVAVRLAGESARWKPYGGEQKKTLIYGAGSAGAMLLRDLRRNPAATYEISGFIDDDPRKAGLVLDGVRVLGNGEQLRELADQHGAALVLIAISTASGPQMKKILQSCTAAGILYKTIPGLSELVDGETDLAGRIRDVAVEDLLGRAPVSLEQDRISAKLRGRSILVTGAAGSIGSEICRQIARFRPAAIIGFDMAESPVFHLQREIVRSFPDIAFHAEIGSIQNAVRLAELMKEYRPSAVFHAAAYKHVPLMERHLFEAIENNVFGTLNVVEAARAHGVADFVMISSDKAVRPANIMGATKRVAEILVRAMQPKDGNYVSVRFGNVLGSNGSVVPIFKEQIARGGPVTVTHPDMRRFFMTIPEACQLVLQASTMGKGGEVFVLDMGEPVRIVDLAHNLILLSGLRPEVDIKIEYSGVRPGEKLYEELNGAEEDLLKTHHEKISVFAGVTKPRHEVEVHLKEFRRHCASRDAERLMGELRMLVTEYMPPGEAITAGGAVARS